MRVGQRRVTMVANMDFGTDDFERLSCLGAARSHVAWCGVLEISPDCGWFANHMSSIMADVCDRFPSSVRDTGPQRMDGCDCGLPDVLKASS